MFTPKIQPLISHHAMAILSHIFFVCLLKQFFCVKKKKVSALLSYQRPISCTATVFEDSFEGKVNGGMTVSSHDVLHEIVLIRDADEKENEKY